MTGFRSDGARDPRRRVAQVEAKRAHPLEPLLTGEPQHAAGNAVLLVQDEDDQVDAEHRADLLEQVCAPSGSRARARRVETASDRDEPWPMSGTRLHLSRAC